MNVPHPRIVGAQRFFARLGQDFDMECPHCGHLYRVRRGKTSKEIWNRRLARFACHVENCHRMYVLGILAWPVEKGRYANRATPPADQVMGPRQLDQAVGEGWWMPREYVIKGRPETTNLTSEPERPEPEDAIELQLLDGSEQPPED